MHFLIRILLSFLIGFILFIQVGCMCLVVPIEYLYRAGAGEKDLSDHFERGHVVGKEYETLQEVYLTQFNDSESLHFQKQPLRAYSYDNDGSKIEVNVYSILEPIPKGTRFKVCKVRAATSFGTELCQQRILATLIDDKGAPISTVNFQGSPSLILVTSLFENAFQMPNQNWIFKPKEDLIREIKGLND